ncbi:diguanylate cyclase (GGDEF) domain-containing protein [Rheinheimera sp. A13L]|uniref:GGDEF domain-containing protein n=1 Tax=Rheinheimera sp. A13L TaxID=506534 RepID=UPI00021248F6|nr:GGDEF domain-containing protein [Rheinheimera sp. A13L]EGM76590.1 diguanylate cyclase (GGDEF) domain-containing protein [Rheinheimera sp. A13L]
MTAEFPLDNFPSGLVVTTVEDRQILFANQYFYKVSQQEPQSVERIGLIFTAASKIVIESFVMPMLLHQGHCEEIQLTLETKSAGRVPVLVNARVAKGDKAVIYWVISTAQQRDALYQELVNLRNDLEQRAEKLEVLSQTDELTGLMNRRAFVARATAMIKQALRSKMSYSFFMLDIDHFKQINDQHGHDVGDEVLQEMGKILAKNSRENDVLARIGGEEFAIVTINQASDSPVKFAEKLLAAIRAEKIHGVDITLSLGLAISAKASFEQLYKGADILLYEAKNQGRNQLVCRDIDQS